MDPKQKEQLVAAVLLAFSRAELNRVEQIEVLGTAVERLHIMQEVDESALMQIAYGMN